MNKKIIISAVIAAIVIPLGVYTISPLFIETTIDESIPIDAQMVKNDTMMKDESAMQQKVMTAHTGQFVGAGDGIHDASGNAIIIPLEDGNNILRLEDFHATNGPDLYVYLATDGTASDYVSLGRLKANNGNQNYDIPSNTDLQKYDTVLIWCKQFSVLFGHAELS